MHPVDQHVGRMIRKRRMELQLQQEALAAALGLSTQQIHKYETGVNRVSASRLFELSKILNISVDYFFCGLEGNIVCANELEDQALPESENGADLSQLQRIAIALAKISKESLREKIVVLVEAMSSDSNELH